MDEYETTRANQDFTLTNKDKDRLKKQKEMNDYKEYTRRKRLQNIYFYFVKKLWL